MGTFFFFIYFSHFSFSFCLRFFYFVFIDVSRIFLSTFFPMCNLLMKKTFYMFHQSLTLEEIIEIYFNEFLLYFPSLCISHHFIFSLSFLFSFPFFLSPYSVSFISLPLLNICCNLSFSLSTLYLLLSFPSTVMFLSHIVSFYSFFLILFLHFSHYFIFLN